AFFFSWSRRHTSSKRDWSSDVCLPIYLTSDMAASLPELVQLTAGAMPFSNGMEIACNAAQIVNDKKATDHHAVIPTRNLQGADLSGLPRSEERRVGKEWRWRRAREHD